MCVRGCSQKIDRVEELILILYTEDDIVVDVREEIADYLGMLIDYLHLEQSAY